MKNHKTPLNHVKVIKYTCDIGFICSFKCSKISAEAHTEGNPSNGVIYMKIGKKLNNCYNSIQ